MSRCGKEVLGDVGVWNNWKEIKKRLNKEIVSGEKKLGVQAVEGPQVQSKNQ